MNTLENPVLKNIDASNLPLSTGEEMRLQHLERQIGESKQSVAKSFMEIGKALTEIRDDKLYRVEFDSFEVYVEKRFKISRIRAYQMISANDVASSLAGILEIKNEAIATALSKVPKPARKKVAREVAKIPERKVTARSVKEIAEQIQSPPRGGLAAMFAVSKAEPKKEDVKKIIHAGPAKTLDIVKKSESPLSKSQREHVRQTIEDWYSKEWRDLNDPTAIASPETMKRRIVALFA